MYLAGRLQKHVVGVVGPTKRIKSAMNKNYSSALQVSRKKTDEASPFLTKRMTLHLFLLL